MHKRVVRVVASNLRAHPHVGETRLSNQSFHLVVCLLVELLPELRHLLCHVPSWNFEFARVFQRRPSKTLQSLVLFCNLGSLPLVLGLLLLNLLR